MRVSKQGEAEVKKGKAIPITGRGETEGCETSRFPHFLDNWLTDDCGCQPYAPASRSLLQEDSWYSFLLEAESTSGS
jgi:hypothetical protein